MAACTLSAEKWIVALLDLDLFGAAHDVCGLVSVEMMSALRQSIILCQRLPVYTSHVITSVYVDPHLGGIHYCVFCFFPGSNVVTELFTGRLSWPIGGHQN